GAGLKVGDDNRTQYLLFLGRNEIAELAGLCHQHWQALAALQPTEPPESGDDKKLKKTTKQQKKEAKEAVPPEIKRKLEQLFNGGKAVDVSLFGRMVADSPGLELDAAAQVAHAVSANAIAAEFDYFTAVDDLQPGEEAGAGMIGTVEFNSACFYRYANVDTGQLDNNLQHDVALARQGLGAFLRAFVLAVPAGKQNSMAAHNPPSFVMTVVRLSGLWSLANAFLKPVTGAATDMVDEAIQRLDAYWNSLTAMYPDGNRVGLCTLHPGCLKALQPHCLDTFEEVVRSTVQSAFPPAG
ncbi:MAG: type I-E CRISPR-associated protein Cas7/Cse4/CasC, partial [Gemmatimonadetes bacterium]|nr:type I-E CRISPR-associated protein Cas7/Cse4/CasC [Gemmatimonadota bacterium]